MPKPSITLSLLTAMFAAELSVRTAAEEQATAGAARTNQTMQLEENEEQKIVLEARLKLGKELQG